ncbi:ABC-type nitrate/sulfonate/bicarbonate transport system, permease component [Paracoccus laeviglucosivorans]|uniref:ABC-type nitrate/sulfonate/bicarbonate transport system, permease component n=1 Tax=Paracoccus laeviglucosivorans TaxID=1197861 RepID=A0A521ETW0_9RHOB|nr:ABC-type nitrate/sulfonate/bicarbonate transport system, permease component [Paracoccus laeviglucosivorans]
MADAVIGTLILLALWQGLAFALQDRFLIAGPAQVLGWSIANAGLIGRALVVTGSNAALGFLAGNLAAIGLAALALVVPRLIPMISGLALVVFCLPMVATGPILRVMMGPGNGPQIVLAALAVYYTTLIPLLAGLRAAPASWLDLIHVYGRGRWAELRHIRLRAALPYLAAGLQIAAPAAFLGAMVGEFTGAERGMGVLTIRFTRALDIPAIWSLAAIAALVAIAAYALIGGIARRILHEPPPVILAPPPGGPTQRGWMQALAVLIAVLALWWAGMRLAGLSPFFAKRPSDVLAALAWAPDAAQTRGTLATALAQTARHVLPGYCAGLALGAGLAVLLGLVPRLSAVLTPLAVALRSIPIVTTAPLIVLLAGRGAAGTVLLVAVMVFFPTFVACQHGLRQAPGRILDVFDSYAASRLRKLIHVGIPAMLPALFAAARISVPAAVLAVTVVEWLATGGGIGGLMSLSASVSDYDMLWSAVVLVTLMSWLGHAVISAAERRVLATHAPEQVRP